ncbi:MAG: hypothetical protein BWY22_01532 [Bacteroidetes bacterium ADurb.Bin217]|nr:MAG: hypothetical protein BWY22_01532 [Bacteroidetes bacterium ADurb.Bin217]
MIYDQQEEIENISWNVSGKIVSLTRIVGSQKADLEFEYDAMGNRIVKRVIPKNPDGTKNMTAIKTTYYVRDAQSNIMASYTQTNTQEIALEEQPIYGSSRLGVYHPTTETGIVRGNRIYEGSNHLGNVLVTFSDRIVFENGDLKPAINSHSDYYAFGMPIKTRTNAARLYKFAFQGQEAENELYGEGNTSFFKFRVSDNRIGRFFAVDPLYAKYAYNSTYAFSENRVIDGVELEGLEYESASNWAYNLYGLTYGNEKGDEMKSFKYSRNPNLVYNSIDCYHSVFFSYAQANSLVADYLEKVEYKINGEIKKGMPRSSSDAKDFFKQGGEYHRMISPNDFLEAQKGDILFQEGHAAIVMESPILSEDGKMFQIKVQTTMARNGLYGESTYTYYKNEDNSWSYGCAGCQKLEGFGRVDETKIMIDKFLKEYSESELKPKGLIIMPIENVSPTINISNE